MVQGSQLSLNLPKAADVAVGCHHAVLGVDGEVPKAGGQCCAQYYKYRIKAIQTVNSTHQTVRRYFYIQAYILDHRDNF